MTDKHDETTEKMYMYENNISDFRKVKDISRLLKILYIG